MVQYCENSTVTLIVTFTYSDIFKLRVAVVRQEMLTKSGASDTIYLRLGWQIHLFCPFWYFSPCWLGMNVLCRNALCHMFVGDTLTRQQFSSIFVILSQLFISNTE